MLDSVFIEYNGFFVTDAAVREVMFTFLARTCGCHCVGWTRVIGCCVRVGEGSFFFSWVWISVWLSLCWLDARLLIVTGKQIGRAHV